MLLQVEPLLGWKSVEIVPGRQCAIDMPLPSEQLAEIKEGNRRDKNEEMTVQIHNLAPPPGGFPASNIIGELASTKRRQGTVVTFVHYAASPRGSAVRALALALTTQYSS